MPKERSGGGRWEGRAGDAWRIDMGRRSWAAGLVVGAVVGLLSAPALGQADLRGTPATTGEPERPLLSGPSVEAPKVPTTLIKRDATGALVRLDLDPAQAALELIELDPSARAVADRILRERSALVDTLVRDDLGLVVRVAQAFQAGDRETAGELVGEIRRALRPLQERGRLVDELAGALPRQAAVKLRSLVREYWQAVMEDRRAQAELDGERFSAARVFAEEGVRLLGAELSRAYERVVTARVEEFESLVTALDLRPELEDELRQKSLDLFQASEGKPDKRAAGKLMLELYGKMNAEERKRFGEALRARSSGM